RVLQIRQELGKTSVDKYNAMARSTCADDRARGILQFCGANRTWRWAGRIIQVQNLPQNKLDALWMAREVLKSGDFELLEMLYGALPSVLSQLIRTVFIPSPGCRFIVSDFSAIEARIIAWLADEHWVLNVFRDHGKIYEAAASQMFKVPMETIVKGHPNYELRAKGKVATLACGYQGGPPALIKMGALKSGIPEEELPGIVKRWRKANPRIVKLWYAAEEAALTAVREKRTIPLAHGVQYRYKSGILFADLPSGRSLAYQEPDIKYDPKFSKDGLAYKDKGENHKWMSQRTYGGRLVENLVQAIARDCLAVSLMRLDAEGYRTVMHVHDEVVLDVPIGTGSVEHVTEIMSQPIEWAPGLSLTAAGFECEFYQKD
ncbi:DNA polymerase, partial [Paenibacillus larvae]